MERLRTHQEVMESLKKENKKYKTIIEASEKRIELVNRITKELEVYKKALELSIKKGVGLMGYGTVEKDRQAETKWKERFIEIAKKEIENEI